jgi:hypothetical protein
MSFFGRSLKPGYSARLVAGYAITGEKFETEAVLRL